MMEYKGYLAQVTFDEEAEIFHGDVLNTKDVITFQSAKANELKREFQKSVEAYLDFCEKLGQEPEKPFSGKFMVRLPPEIHRQIFIAAKAEGKSLNTWITEKLSQTDHP